MTEAAKDILCWALLYAALALNANAEPGAPFPNQSSEDYAALLEVQGWLNQHFGQLRVSFSGLPALCRTDQKHLNQLAYGNATRLSQHRILGLYDFEQHTIYIAEELDLNAARGRSILLHELVHHAQFSSKQFTSMSGDASLEPMAYQIESLYLSDHADSNRGGWGLRARPFNTAK
ncbi:MAG: DUF6647 family protein [Pseudomonadota bacterium]